MSSGSGTITAEDIITNDGSFNCSAHLASLSHNAKESIKYLISKWALMYVLQIELHASEERLNFEAAESLILVHGPTKLQPYEKCV